MIGVSALILAGGRATRFGGIAKHEIVVEGRTIFERQVAVLAPRVHEIIVSSQQPIAGYRTVADAVPDGGPLAGIAAGLAAATTRWLLVVAGDMPYIEPAVRLLLGDGVNLVNVSPPKAPEPQLPVDAAGDGVNLVNVSPSSERLTRFTPSPDAIAFSIGGLPEPLLCLLRCEPAAKAITRLIADGERKTSRLLTDAGLQVVWFGERELRAVDPDLHSLKNINEPADLGES